MSEHHDIAAVRSYLLELQDRITSALEERDGGRFREDRWERPDGGGGRTRVLAEGAVFERAGIGFSDIRGASLPASASAHRPEISGRPFEVTGVSLIVHPRNPYVPTAHLNARFFAVGRPDGGAWWFGGGLDLTPYYGFEEDAVAWHRTVRAALEPFGAEVYPRFKRWCDDYFYIRHRDEHRGIGGAFFDDLNEGGFARCFGLARAVGDAFLPAYLPILDRRRDAKYGERQRDFQLYRRGRYVEFNLVYDRGTIFGLQSRGRTESILISLPPLVRWRYGFVPEPGSAEERLATDFLRPRDWANGG